MILRRWPRWAREETRAERWERELGDGWGAFARAAVAAMGVDRERLDEAGSAAFLALLQTGWALLLWPFAVARWVRARLWRMYTLGRLVERRARRFHL